MLGQGTFRDARPAWEALAGRFAALGSQTEVALYKAGGAEYSGCAHMHDTSPAGLASSGGAMAILVWPAPEVEGN